MKQLLCWLLFVAALVCAAPGAWAQQAACSGEWQIVNSPDPSNIGYSFNHGPASGFCAAEAVRDASAGVASCVVAAYPVGVGAVTVEQVSGKTVTWEEMPWACSDSTADAAAAPASAASGSAGTVTLDPGSLDVDLGGQMFAEGFTGVLICYVVAWSCARVLEQIKN